MNRLRHSFALLGLLLVLSGTAAFAQFSVSIQVEPKTAVDYVDPFIGTGGHGHTYPGATVPFGMVQLSPDGGNLGWDWCSGYHFSDTSVVGFSHTHLSGTGCADLGDILVTPTTSARNLDLKYRSPISHEQEHAEPGYYRVMLLDHDIKAELTATERCGFHCYTFPASDSACLIFNAGYGQDDSPMETQVKIENDSTIVGYRFSAGWAKDQRIYFAASLSRPMKSFVCGDGEKLVAGQRESTGKYVRAAVYFKTEGHDIIRLKVGISSVSIDGAKKNLAAEIPGWDFDKTRFQATTKWLEALNKISVEQAGDSDKTTFYTALYHTMLAPTLFCDVDGQYRGADGKIHTAKGHDNYSTFSLWDTFRAAHPLYTMIQTARVKDLIQSMLEFYKENGLLPIWPLQQNETNCMIGYHSIPVITDAYFKGLRDFDVNLAYEAMKASALGDQRGLKYYNASPPKTFQEQLAAMVKRYGVEDTTTLDTKPLVDSAVVLSGYNDAVDGEVIHYHSSSSRANEALLTRALDGKKTITWETETLLDPTKARYVTFVWLAGMASEKGGHTFTLSANGTPLVDFTTAKLPTRTSFTIKGKNGVTLAFQAQYIDQHHDLFGNMYLKVPVSMVEVGKPLKLSVTGEAADAWDWFMTFKHKVGNGTWNSNEYGLSQSAGKKQQYIRHEEEHLGVPHLVVLSLSGGKPDTITVEPGVCETLLPVESVKTVQKLRLKRWGLARGDVVPSQYTHVPFSESVAEVDVQPVERYGFVPADKERESASKTMEYAYDDWCIAQMAKVLGKTDDYDLFMKRAGFYKNLFDSTCGFIRGKNLDGTWVSPFDPQFSTEKQPEYTEGNAWQYTWFVPQDVQGLINLMGGKEKFVQKLDSLFTLSVNLDSTGAPPDVTGLVGLYAQGNEPSHHIAYLYDYAGMPWKTQERVHHILRDFYKPTRDGLIGNEDCGQMSAWYVLGAMGFYPVNPAEGIYEIGTPLLEKATINGNFTMTAKNLSDKNMYVQSARLNGQPLKHCYITHQEIMNGGTLEFVMGEQPNKSLWTTSDALPPSMTAIPK